MRGMQLISSASAPARRPVGAIVSGTLVGATLVAGGLSLAYLALATPLLMALLPSGRLDAGQMASGMIVMAFALVAPIVFVAVGTTRLAKLLASLRPRHDRVSLLERLGPSLPADVVGASDVTLYDGRTIPALIVGTFGVLILRDAPRPGVSRFTGSTWEVRTTQGWAPSENPMERASRDADRVRQWLSHDDRDFLVKTYAAVIVPAERGLTRSATCAVLAAEQVPAFLASLPAQRSLTPSRIDGLVDQIRGAIARP
jgi:hypothetical protein